METDLVRHTSAGTALIGIGDDERGRIVRANGALAELLASTPEALAGTLICDHIHPADRSRALDAFTQIVGDASGSYEGSGRLVGADGQVRHVAAYVTVVATGTRQAALLRVAKRRV